jgi:hypothetical protein
MPVKRQKNSIGSDKTVEKNNNAHVHPPQNACCWLLPSVVGGHVRTPISPINTQLSQDIFVVRQIPLPPLYTAQIQCPQTKRLPRRSMQSNQRCLSVPETFQASWTTTLLKAVHAPVKVPRVEGRRQYEKYIQGRIQWCG